MLGRRRFELAVVACCETICSRSFPNGPHASKRSRGLQGLWPISSSNFLPTIQANFPFRLSVFGMPVSCVLRSLFASVAKTITLPSFVNLHHCFGLLRSSITCTFCRCYCCYCCAVAVAVVAVVAVVVVVAVAIVVVGCC